MTSQVKHSAGHPAYEWAPTEQTLLGLRTRASEAVRGIVRYLLAHADESRTDRLWPAAETVFLTNPLSLAHGAMGTAVFLRRAEGALRANIRSWLERQPVSADEYPPGLFPGLAGIAWGWLELGNTQRAMDTLRLAVQSPLAERDSTLAEGMAGWGTVALSIWRRTGDERYRELAVRAAEAVERSATRDASGVSWKRVFDGRTYFGYAYGGAGIGHFLQAVADVAPSPTLSTTAAAACATDLAAGVRLRHGLMWPKFRGDQVAYPYFVHGGSGIGAVLLRHQDSGHWAALKEQLGEIARDSYCIWSVNPSLFDGHSGIGEFMLDMHQATGDPLYVKQAYRVAKSVLMYAVSREEGIAFPGRWLDRLTTDVATGSSGVGLFLLRLLDGGPRFLVDF